MSPVPYRYRVHGLTVESELELPELLATDGSPDVVVRVGDVPEQLEGPVRRGPCYQASPGHCLIRLPGVARYWVREGREVIVAPEADAPATDVRVFVLSSVMGALMHQRGLLAMHASAVEIDGTAVLFAGESGAGKSTVTAACCDRGYRVVTDDMSVITFGDAGEPLVHPGSRHIKLWADALDAVGTSLGTREPTRAGMRRFWAAIPGEPPAAPLVIGHLFLLTTRRADRIEVQPLSGREKVTALLRETYRRRLWLALGRRGAQFTQCAALGRRVRLARVNRPFDLQSVPALVDAIERDIRTPR